MSYTNSTSHYGLPQYLATDKPKYLTDFNETMETIDGQMYANATAAATADSKAEAAQDTADANTSSIGTLNTQINGDPTDPSDTGLAGDVSSVQGQVDTINALIGNGTPTTTDKTIIGAINELNAAVAQAAAAGRKFILIGDSFACGIIGGGADWVDGWADYFADLFPGNVFWYDPASDVPFEGTSGFTTNSDKNFIGQLQYVKTSKLGDVDPKDITDIIVLGGTNDVANAGATLTTAIDDFFTYVRTNFVNAQVSVGCFGLNVRGMVNDSTTYTNYKARTQANGGVFLEDILRLGCSQTWDSGYGHLNSTGYGKVNPLIANCILSGHVQYFFVDQLDLTINDGADGDVDDIGSFTWKLVISRTNETVRIRVIDSFRSVGSLLINKKTYSGSGSQAVNAFTGSNKIYQPFAAGSIFDDLFVYVFDSTNNVYAPAGIGAQLLVVDPTTKYPTVKFSSGFPWPHSGWTTENLRFGWAGVQGKNLGAELM